MVPLVYDNCDVIGQMYLMDSFLGGQFSTYGMDVIRISGMEVSSLFREIAILSVYPFR